MNENYVPFGEEWKKEMMQIPKKTLIELLKNALVEKQPGISGAIIKHSSDPDTYGWVAIRTFQGNYAIVREHQEQAKKNIGKQVRVKEHSTYYRTVMILDYQS